MIRTLGLVLLAGCLFAGTPRPMLRPVARTILAIYDSHYHRDVRDTRIHRLLEMPLNHLGLLVQYRDINTGLPPVGQLSGVRGILTWFQADSMQNPEEFLKWAGAAIDAGKRFVVIGNLSVERDLKGRMTRTAAINAFLAKLGIRSDDWTPITYDQRIVYADPAMLNFERPLPAVLPPFDRVRLIDPRVRSHLVVRRRNDAATDSHLIVTGPHGGWVSNGYSHFASYREDQYQWYINPFEFLRLAFATDEVPKLDTTTLSGRRIYYSHIDGDGWRNLTEMPSYQRDKLSSAEVILKEAVEPFPDLPVTVGPIVGDLDPNWFGTRESLELARRFFSLPWVEAGSHTYSHPLDWESLCGPSANTGRKPRPHLLDWFEPAQWTAFARIIERYSRPEAQEGSPTLRRGHSRLRSYNLYPFDLGQEVHESIAFLNRLLPGGKRVQLLQWSGTTLVPEAALEAAHREGVRNINGGDTRFDPEFNSYAWVAPLTRQAGALRQVYSSDSNEDTYTNLWNERYFGFRYLPETLRRTESPIRIKPFNLYYHMYSGEKQPSLKALLENLRYARSQELAPVSASQYSAIVEGFHSAAIAEVAPRRWRIENRDAVDTVRFDHADGESVDFEASVGVVGERRFQDSLYVALDAAQRAPLIVLLPRHQPRGGPPYLIESRWQISRLRVRARQFEFYAHGFGAGEMSWKVPPGTSYLIRVSRGGQALETIKAAADAEGGLRFTIPGKAIDPVAVQVAPTGVAK